jgi:hypothetical protein
MSKPSPKRVKYNGTCVQTLHEICDDIQQAMHYVNILGKEHGSEKLEHSTLQTGIPLLHLYFVIFFCLVLYVSYGMKFVMNLISCAKNMVHLSFCDFFCFGIVCFARNEICDYSISYAEKLENPTSLDKL